MGVPIRILIQEFILDYLRENDTISILEEEFHDGFHNQFGGKRSGTRWGSDPVYKAQRWLERLYRQSILDRSRISIRDPEFPNWVYIYTLSDTTK